MFWKPPFIKHIFTKEKNKKQELPASTKSDQEKQHVNESYHQAIGRMAAFFAHEIRNPLTSIVGFAQFLAQDETVKSNAHINQYISIIKEEALKMEVLIEELLNLSTSHLHQDHLSIINVQQSISMIISVFQMQERYKQIQFKAQLMEDCYVLGNAHQFERVLINLFKNAIEAMNEQGTIEIFLLKKSSSVHIDIIDHGPGLAPEDVESIYIPFFTTKDEGTGIGLPICKTIIEAMRGKLEINNHPSKGVHISIEMPQSKQTTSST